MTIAQQLHDIAFSNKHIPPKSEAYKAGAMVALQFCDDGEKDPIDGHPYAPGTAESDAWWAGVREGYQLWAAYQQSLQDGAA